jgi:hypothetical protein
MVVVTPLAYAKTLGRSKISGGRTRRWRTLGLLLGRQLVLPLGRAAKAPPLGHLHSRAGLDYNYKTDEAAAAPHSEREGVLLE